MKVDEWQFYATWSMERKKTNLLEVVRISSVVQEMTKKYIITRGDM